MMTREVVPELAAHIEARMLELKIDSVAELARLTGLTPEGLTPLLRGVRKAYQRRLTRPVCDALGWTHDSIAHILAGGQPELAVPTDDTPDVSDLLAEVRKVASRFDALEQRLDSLESRLGPQDPPAPDEPPATPLPG